MSFSIPIKNLYEFPEQKPFYLGEDSQIEQQPKEIKIQLKEHQRTSYCQMKSLEHKDGFYFINSKGSNVIKINNCKEYLQNLYDSNSEHSINHFRTNYWILSDKTGYGKTLTACCCLKDKETVVNPITNLEQIDKEISLNNRVFNIPYDISSKNGDNYSSFKIKINEKCEDFKINNLICFNTTLIIVPYGKVFTQWCDTLNNHTSYNGIQIKNTKKVLEEKIQYKKLTNIIEKINEIYFSKYHPNLFVEDADNLSIYKNRFENLSNIEINILKELFLELLEYKKYFDELDYILIVNTFTRNYFDMCEKYVLCLSKILEMYLTTLIAKDLLKFINKETKELNKCLYSKYKRGYSSTSKYLFYLNDFKIIIQDYMHNNNALRGYSKLIHLINKNVSSIINGFDYSSSIKINFMFYRIIIDEADTINLKGNYTVYLNNRYQKLGLLTATYEKLLEGNSYSNVFNSLIIPRGYSGGNAYYPIILNDDKFLEKSFSMPVVNKNYLICEYNQQLSDIMHNASYLESQGLLSSEVKELLNVNDFNGALKKMGATENSNDNIIDIICKDVLRNLKNKKIEKDMISKLDLEQNLKNARLATINKAIKELEEKLNDLNAKFQDISIYDKLASKYGEEFVSDLDEVYNEVNTMNITEKNKQDVSNIFDKYNIDKTEQENAYLYEKVMSLINNPNKFCGICASVYRKPVLLNCSHIYCSECISQLIRSSGGNNCPLCRTPINFKKLCLIMNELEEETKEEEKKIIIQIKNLSDVFELILDYDKKINNENNNNLNDNDVNETSKSKSNKSKKLNSNEEKYIKKYKTNNDKIESVNKVLNYIQNTNPNRKVLVFSNHQLITQNIKETIERKDLLYKSEIMTGIGTENCINRFKNKDSNLLFLSAKKNAAGIELPEGTDVILLHKMSEEIETQIIGRCMRMGRKEPLNVYYLYHDNEFDFKSINK